MDLDLKGKTAIVTGGGSNIGRGIVMCFANEGANIVIADIDEKQSQKVLAQANAVGKGGRSISVKTDVTDANSVQAMVKKVLQEFGQIDALVNNVGGATLPTPFVQTKKEWWDTEIKLNFVGTLECTQAVLPHMIERKQGVLVHIASGAAIVGAASLSLYSAQKAAVLCFSRAIARENGPLGIRSNCICPGLIVPENIEAETGETSHWKGSWSIAGQSKEAQAEYLKKSGMKRFGRGYDIGNAVVFLCSERASYVNGQYLIVDGGTIMHS